MNSARAALLLATAILSGCATRPPERADSTKRNAPTPALERPGLGTSWGEQRESWVEPAPFARSSDRPSAQARIYYNDREGANAMLAFLGGPSRASEGLQSATGGSLRLGLRNGHGTWIRLPRIARTTHRHR